MRLLSYNIHKGIGGRDRLVSIAAGDRCHRGREPRRALPAGSRPPIPAARISTISRSLLADYFKLAAQLFSTTSILRTGGYGNLILSRWPLTVAASDFAATAISKKPRGAQIGCRRHARRTAASGEFSSRPCRRRTPLANSNICSTSLVPRVSELPTLLVGDYNDWRNRLHRGLLSEHGFEQITSPISRFRSFPAYLALSSLDKAFIRDKVKVRHARVVRTPLTRRASDHLPLVIDFHLAEREMNGMPHNV